MSAKPKLRFGQQGPAVKELQATLNTVAPLLVPALKEDGIFGPKTLVRVKDVQQRGQLKPDGIVGPLTWELLGAVIAGGIQLAGEVSAGLPLTENPWRGMIVKTAWDEWMYHGAQVHAKYKGGEDPVNHKTYRQGHERLMLYFSTSAPAPGKPGSTYYGDDNVRYLPSWFGQKPGDTIKPWCGIFALWVVKSSGLSGLVGNWKDGGGIDAVDGIDWTPTPRRGDIAYRKDKNHHAVVYDVVSGPLGTRVVTIDGNSPPGSSITKNENPIKIWHSFYRVNVVWP